MRVCGDAGKKEGGEMSGGIGKKESEIGER